MFDIIRIFKDINECNTLDSIAISNLSVGDDVYYKNQPTKSYYAKEILFDEVKYSFFAYEFEDITFAKNYFLQSSTKVRFSSTEKKDFKIVSTDNKTELTVWKNNMVYHLIGKDPEHFNSFRHYIGTIFNSTVYDQ